MSIALPLALILALVLGTVAYAGQGIWGTRAWKGDPGRQTSKNWMKDPPELAQEYPHETRTIGNTALDPGNTASNLRWDGSRGAVRGAGLDWIDPTEAVRAAGTLAAAEGVGGPVPIAGIWYLYNGAFDMGWSAGTPDGWTVIPGAAWQYGQLPMGTDNFQTWDSAFQFQFNAPGNAYLYQKIHVPGGDYWVDLHSTVFAADVGKGVVQTWDYGHMMYYAIVPDTGTFSVSNVGTGGWRELWPYTEACEDEKTLPGNTPEYGCAYVQRAETVTLAEGNYFFVVRAEQKWPGSSWVIFDDFQMIDANPAAAKDNACPWTGPKKDYQGWYCKHPTTGKYMMLEELKVEFGTKTDFEACLWIVDPCDKNFRVEGGIWR